MKVFVSSTVFDLVDVRAELKSYLPTLNVEPLMSEEPLSGFDVTLDRTSVEECLRNVERSNLVVVILDRRYGPRLGNSGYPDVSATHLEYRHAHALNKPIHLYARGRLISDYDTWRSNNKADDLALQWVKTPNDRGLFTILDEHRPLDAAANKSNWYTTFDTSVTLKSYLERHLAPRLKPAALVEAVSRNAFPLFTASARVDVMQNGTSRRVFLDLTVTNVSGAPAFDTRVYWHGKTGDPERMGAPALVAPNRSVEFRRIWPLPEGTAVDATLSVSCESAIGVCCREWYQISFQNRGNRTGNPEVTVTLQDRHFVNSTKPTLKIDGL